VIPRDLPAWLGDPQREPLVMGILNLTPDSFSDGGAFLEATAAIDHAHRMVEAGADWIDVGGESTRPGAGRVSAGEQIARVIPILRAVRQHVPVVISIDTTLAPVAAAALDCGANAVNDISAGRDGPSMFALVAERRVPIILMHMQGQPATMQINPSYGDVVAEVRAFLADRIGEAMNAGIERSSILIDPGIGFGKTVEHNLDLLRRLEEFADLGCPIVVGTSRKGFIAKVTSDNTAERSFGTAASVAWSVANRAAAVRVHDVGPMSQVARMIRAIQTGKPAIFAAGQSKPAVI
jgi:dihydropteroate synthase